MQQFESTFFKLVDLHYNIIANLNYSNKSAVPLSGNQVFDAAKKMLINAIRVEYIVNPNRREALYNPIIELQIKDLQHSREVYKKQYYQRYYGLYENELNHYFRNLFHILKYIDKSSLIDSKQKHFYASILRAQLSQNQIFVWLFNSMHEDYGYPDALYLIKRYQMMQNFRSSEIKPHYYWDSFNSMIENVSPSNHY